MTDTETSDWVLVPREGLETLVHLYEEDFDDAAPCRPEWLRRALAAAPQPLSASPKGDGLEPVVWQHKLTGLMRSDKPHLGIDTDYTPLYPASALQSLKAERDALAISLEHLADNKRAADEQHAADMAEMDAERATLKREIAELREALTEISSPTQSTNLLWWQERARRALPQGGK